MFQDNRQADGNSLQKLQDGQHGCAFDNPYFSEELANCNHISQNNNSLSTATCANEPLKRASDDGTNLGLLTTATRQQPDSQHLHFIEHHISNLHNRQVTSSVKELSILGE